MSEPYEQVLRFWLGEPGAPPLANTSKWFTKDSAFDQEIRDRFGAELEAARRGEREHWRTSPRGALAYVILLDQFSRNIWRDQPEAFAADEQALAASLEAQERGLDRQLTPIERAFLYMPMMHAEDRALQARSVAAFQDLATDAPEDVRGYLQSSAQYAVRHREIIDRFGRFPHRNGVLERTTTIEESDFLTQPGSSF